MFSLNNKKLISVIIICLLLTSSLALIVITEKPSIHNVTYEELTEIDDIGGHYALAILTYLNDHENATVDDLDSIHGISDIRVENIKEKFK